MMYRTHRLILVLGLTIFGICLVVLHALAAPSSVNIDVRKNSFYEVTKDLNLTPEVNSDGTFGETLRVSEEYPWWWDDKWEFRVEFSIGAAGYERNEKAVEIPLDFADLLEYLSVDGTVDFDSLRVIEIDTEGIFLSESVPFQYDPLSSTEGTLIVLMTGQTPAEAERHYQLYFDVDDLNDFLPQKVAAQVIVTDDVLDEGFNSVKITTSAPAHSATYFYHKAGGGFSSLEDSEGKDWVSYSTAAGTAGDFRGIPNLVPPGSGGYFHPGRTGVDTEIISQGPLKATLLSTVKNLNWQVMWEIYPTYATLSVLEVEKDVGYWFLYEGTPGGELNTIKDYVVRSIGEKSFAWVKWEGDLQEEEWVYFSDPDLNRSLYLVHHEDDMIPESYRPQEDLMTVFGFGRAFASPLGGLLQENQQHFTIGLIDEVAFEPLQTAIRSAYKDVVVIKKAPERRLYTLEIEIQGQGVVEAFPDLPEYYYGQQVTLQANPAPGWIFSEWEEDLLGNDPNPMLVIEGDVNITAIFVEEEFEPIIYFPAIISGK